ncbi:hypothetical protein [Streptomyces sp. NRRL S-1896]|uniref:hypothetical protein n=1 Tax=Streptomyces sp. NRRL S-1896 TaxID=1463893 RepID=UPI0006C22000|nr:hypothetical protein [Streptomyces sp. NRRL S-1896]KOV73444.1 hypothetical protein ADL02_39385 [Streptomyces sp. NRRL WC-3723]
MRCLRLLVVLTATALPAHGTAVAYGGTPVLAAEPDTARPSATGHRQQAGTRQGTRQGAARGHAPALTAVPQHGPLEDTAAEHAAPDRGRPDQGPPRKPSPDGTSPDGTSSDETASEEASEETSSEEAPSDETSSDETASEEAPAAVPMPSDSASASVRPYRPLASVEPSRAGSRAGEGRMRPGRPDGPEIEDEGDDDPPPATPAAQPEEPEEPETAEVPSVSPSPLETGPDPTGSPQGPGAEQAAQQGEAPTEPVLRILPLGSGLVLIGLGLGLALLGLRLRKS